MAIVSMTLKNNSNQTLYVLGDPNWDDQQLIIDGEAVYGSVSIAQSETILVEVKWPLDTPQELMMGIYISEDKYADNNFLIITLGENSETKLLDVTECDKVGSPKEIYQVSEASVWRLTLSLYPEID